MCGAVGIVLAMSWVAWWLLRTDDAVLFTDLRPQDASTIAAELEKQKIPYAVADDGATLLVDKAQVHTTRLKIMGKDLPLSGAVGFELFNTSDFGMTEFAQKINYQRALQGELTRSILAFPEVKEARVHLALPEQTLFKQANSKPKAAVTLSLRQGKSLRQEQTHGIQRLIAAAVPGLQAQEVTIVDEHGVAISRSSDGDVEGSAGSVRLDLKRETEQYLSKKVSTVLERTFGEGQATASVDVTLSMDQIRVTTEDVIPSPTATRGNQLAGVLVRERESIRDNGGGDARQLESRGNPSQTVQRELEYQTGRRVEQMISQAGAIRRIQVVALVQSSLDATQQEQIRRMVAAAVGASAERGDTIVVQSVASTKDRAEIEEPVAVGPKTSPVQSSSSKFRPEGGTYGLVLMAIILFVGVCVAISRRNRVSASAQLDRQAALERVRDWMRQEELTASGRGTASSKEARS